MSASKRQNRQASSGTFLVSLTASAHASGFGQIDRFGVDFALLAQFSQNFSWPGRLAECPAYGKHTLSGDSFLSSRAGMHVMLPTSSVYNLDHNLPRGLPEQVGE